MKNNRINTGKLNYFSIAFLIIFCSTCIKSEVKLKEKKVDEYKYTNNLINETSPYLLQHAHNPVNWYP